MAMVCCIHVALVVQAIIYLQHIPSFANEKTYIVYMGVHSHGLQPTQHDAEVATQSHYDLLGSVLGSNEKARESVLYSYNKYINGFVAKLTEDEAERIKSSPNVVAVLENRPLQLHTTRSWEFLGLEQNGVTPNNSLWKNSRYGDGVIIGNIDKGVWPESESFNDQELGPIPSKWKGSCMTGSDTTFKCNKKLIGAKYFCTQYRNCVEKSPLSPRDFEGHGTHTLSTAGGNFVKEVNVYGFGSGVAKGGSPNARVAAYKVCWSTCLTADVLAGIEAAIGDGVDVLSVSLGAPPTDYKSDVLATGSFHAVRHGITVVASAGNDGPEKSTVSNLAPWIFTIGASTSDRDFFNKVHLGNSSLNFKGSYLGPSQLLPIKHFYPLIDGVSAMASSSTTENASLCQTGSLDPSKVKGKIVICSVSVRSVRGPPSLAKGLEVQAAGGVGMILLNDETVGDFIVAEPHFLPASRLSYIDGVAVMDYINKTTNPTAYISDVKTLLGIKPAPVMADFSSRGPGQFPQILKPDVIAPGVNVIAAYSGSAGPSGYPNDTRRVNYYVMSGTSMSAPHVSGIVGLLKSLHSDWSPAAIRSALMTTATEYDNDKKRMQNSDKQQATPFDYGAGHINPNAAADPGPIYNLTETDYLDFLCSLGSYTEKDLKAFTQIDHKCSNTKTILDLNYPSITINNFTTSAILKRTVTNVGNPGTYEVKVTAPNGINVNVHPSTLKFYRIGEVRTFRVRFKANGRKPEGSDYVFGSLVWSDGNHNVRSPIVVGRL